MQNYHRRKKGCAFHTHSHRKVSSFLKVNKSQKWTIHIWKYVHPLSPWAGLEYNLIPFLDQITSLQLNSTMSNAKVHFRRRDRQTKVQNPNYFSFRTQKGRRPHQWNGFIKHASSNCSLHCVISSIFFGFEKSHPLYSSPVFNMQITSPVNICVHTIEGGNVSLFDITQTHR